jgi:putative ABC transport system permease protein
LEGRRIACINFTNLSIGRATTRSLEVGVRKVLGANSRQLIHQFWGEFLAITGIAMIAVLDNYHHRISIGTQYFLLAGVISFAVALMTTASLAVRAALANPVESLRNE